MCYVNTYGVVRLYIHLRRVMYVENLATPTYDGYACLSRAQILKKTARNPICRLVILININDSENIAPPVGFVNGFSFGSLQVTTHTYKLEIIDFCLYPSCRFEKRFRQHCPLTMQVEKPLKSFALRRRKKSRQQHPYWNLLPPFMLTPIQARNQLLRLHPL